MGFLQKIYGGPITQAVRNGDVDQVASLLKNGADPNESQLGITALAQACSSGNVEIVKLLLEHGADVNAKDWDGLTVLMNAARGLGNPDPKSKEERSLEIVKLLLEKGANVNYRSWRLRTAAKEAQWAGHHRVKEMLEQHQTKT